MAKKAKPVQVRITLHSPPEFGEAANVWVDNPAPGVFALLHDYPDLKPQAGWRVETGGKTYIIDRVSGSALHCTELS